MGLVKWMSYLGLEQVVKAVELAVGEGGWGRCVGRQRLRTGCGCEGGDDGDGGAEAQ